MHNSSVEMTVQVRKVIRSQQIRAPLIYWKVYLCIKFSLKRVSLGPQDWYKWGAGTVFFATPELISCSVFFVPVVRTLGLPSTLREKPVFKSDFFFLFPAFEQARIYIAQVSLN